MIRKKYSSALVFLLLVASILFSSPEVRADLIEAYVQCDAFGNQTVTYQTINPYGTNERQVVYRYSPSCGRAVQPPFPAGCPAIPGYANRAAVAMMYLQMGMGRPGSFSGALGAGMAARLAADAAAAGCR